MHEVINFSKTIQQPQSESGKESFILKELLDLFWHNPTWFVEFTEYCHAPYNHSICQENYDYLLLHNLILADMSVPSSVLWTVNKCRI